MESTRRDADLKLRLAPFQFISAAVFIFLFPVVTPVAATNCMLTQTSARCAHDFGYFLSTDEFTYVHALYIVESNFSDTSPKDFSNFKDLYTLHISNSSDMAPNLLSSISSQLTELRIAFTPLGNSNALIGKGESHLAMLTLVDVGLVHISSDFFGNHSKMEVLELEQNKIAYIESGAFDGLPELLKLNLSQNHLEIVPSGIFSHLKLLRVLDLRKNSISILKKHALRGLDSLQVLNLSSNKISVLEWGALEGGVKHLQMLDLRGNVLGAGFQHRYLPSENNQRNGISCIVCQSNCTAVATHSSDDMAACTASVAPAALWRDFAILDDANSRLGSRVYLNDNPVCNARMQISFSSMQQVADDAKEQTGLEGSVECATLRDECLPHERFRLFLLEACVEGVRKPLEIPTRTNQAETNFANITMNTLRSLDSDMRKEDQTQIHAASLHIYALGFAALFVTIFICYIVYDKKVQTTKGAELQPITNELDEV